MWKNGKEQNGLKFDNRFTRNKLEYNNCIKIRLNHSIKSIYNNHSIVPLPK